MADIELHRALDNLGDHLCQKTSAKFASRMTLSQVRAETESPYIGVVNAGEDVLMKDPYTERLAVSINLYLVVKESDIGLEEFKQEVKDALRSASLGDNVHGIEYEGASISVIEDFRQPDAEQYSGCMMLVTLLFMDNHTTAPTLAEATLTEPVGFSHYKIYALMTSGSIATNTYHHHDKANIALDAITVGVESSADSEDARSITALKQQYINHATIISVRYHGSYDPGSLNHATVRQRMDEIVSKLKTNFDLGDRYKMLEFSSIVYDTPFPESQTRGGQVNVRVDKLLRHTQE